MSDDTPNVVAMPPIVRDFYPGRPSFSRFGFESGSGDYNRPYKWLVKNLIPDNALALLGGAAASGKTFILIYIIACIITGQRIFGRFEVQRPGAVIYCTVEGTQGIRHRFEACRQHMGIDRDLWNRRLIKTTQLFRFNSTDPEAFIKYIRDVEAETGEKVVLVVFDTLRTYSGIQDENGSGDAQQALAWMRYVSHGADCTTLAIHHAGKNTDNPTRPGDGFDKVLRGSSDFGGSAEVVLGVAKAKTEAGDEVSWLWGAKLKDVPVRPPIPAPIESYLLPIDGHEPESVGVVSLDVNIDIELAEEVKNPKRGQQLTGPSDARHLAKYACSGCAPANWQDMKAHFNRLCADGVITDKDGGVIDNDSTRKGRFRRAMEEITGHPSKYGIEILTPNPNDQDYKEYWRILA